ncbi:MAG TPA: hypothetical protein ENN67_01945 [Firmicutes bacterium]|nr:hypothetical protein [Bacillota bacterium]
MIEIKTGNRTWDEFIPIVSRFHDASLTVIEKNGKSVTGYHTPDCPWLWFRDNIHMMENTVYLLDEIRSMVDFMLETQNPDGSYFDYLAQDGSMLRVPTEADLEYLAVIGVFRAWLATGDDEWMRSCIPALERGLNYMTSHPWRWDEKYRMPKRAFTIDTWDFDFRDGLEKLHWPGKIDHKTHFGIMHGDVSGLFYAWTLMAQMLEHLGLKDEAGKYREKRKDIRESANKLLWNGRFYRHRLPLDGFTLAVVDEENQLSLSNPYDINRGLPTPDMARSIIREYMRRRTETSAFAEWFSIDPPFPDRIFGDEKLKPGVYVNGGIMPLVGGELAQAAFKYGFPEYGVDILKRYFEMIYSTGEAYLWYLPDGSPATKEASTSPEAYPTDCWGSSAMASALIKGLAGVRTGKPGFEALWLEPRWITADIDHAEVTLGYPSSGKKFRYIYTHYKSSQTTEIVIDSTPLKALHVGVPEGVDDVEVECCGKKLEIEIENWELGRAFCICDKIDKEIKIIFGIL